MNEKKDLDEIEGVEAFERVREMMEEADIALLPDEYDIHLERKEDEWKLTYKEFFTYVPQKVADTIAKQTIDQVDKRTEGEFGDYNLLSGGAKLELTKPFGELMASILPELMHQASPKDQELIMFVLEKLRGITEDVQLIRSAEDLKSALEEDKELREIIEGIKEE